MAKLKLANMVGSTREPGIARGPWVFVCGGDGLLRCRPRSFNLAAPPAAGYRECVTTPRGRPQRERIVDRPALPTGLGLLAVPRRWCAEPPRCVHRAVGRRPETPAPSRIVARPQPISPAMAERRPHPPYKAAPVPH